MASVRYKRLYKGLRCNHTQNNNTSKNSGRLQTVTNNKKAPQTTKYNQNHHKLSYCDLSFHLTAPFAREVR